MKFTHRRHAKASRKVRDGRPLRPSEFYVLKKEHRAKQTRLRYVTSALSAAQHAVQVAMISAMPAMDKFSKAMDIMAACINAADSIQNIMKQPYEDFKLPTA
jgi:hypothetical protein